MQPVDIRPDHLAIVLGILARHVPEAEVWVFGSRAKWLARDTSDLDLCIRTAAPIGFARMGVLREAFEESNLPYKVDVVDWSNTSESFRKIIERDKVVIQEAKRGGGMPGERKDITLGDFVALQRGHDLTESERRPGHVPVIGSAGQNGYHDTALAKGPGIVIGRSGASFGQVHFCATDYWPHNTGLYVTDFKGNDPRFAYYFLKALDFDRYNSGSAQPSLNRNFIYPIPIRVPEPDEQKAIAHILGTLDDRIELNRRMNATLEAMARALFQSWFVDFDPVRAKLDGRQPAGLDAATAALFPAHFQESPLGHIPQGWRVGSIYEISNVIYGAPFASKQFNTNSEGKPLIRIRDLADENPGVWTPEVHPKGYTVRPGDIAVGMDGEFRAYLWGGVPAWLNQRVCVFAPKADFSAAFVRNSIIAPLAEVEATETATTVIHLGKNDIDRFRVIIPSPEVHAIFSKLCQPWYDQIVANKQQSRTLATIRDAMLPKLLSGVIRVTHVEDEVASV